MDLRLKGKRAVVLGASQGIGKAIAEVLVQEGAEVAICARNPERLEKTAQEIGAVFSFPVDLSLARAGEKAVQAAIERFGGLDILVSNTGGPPKGNFRDLQSSDWQTAFQGLWMSAVDAMRVALPFMEKQKWGRVILVTSVAAKEPILRLTTSSALRAGLLGLTKTLARDYAASGVTINSILPGYTKTERLAELGKSDEELSEGIPAKRLADPKELGALAAFLSSEQASYLTGQAIALDGAWLHSL